MRLPFASQKAAWQEFVKGITEGGAANGDGHKVAQEKY